MWREGLLSAVVSNVAPVIVICTKQTVTTYLRNVEQVTTAHASIKYVDLTLIH